MTAVACTQPRRGAAIQGGDCERSAATGLARRGEPRGLPGTRKAKAARPGAAEDDPVASYDQARAPLRTAPCGLTAAAAAVAGYQRALQPATREGGRR